MSIGFDKARFGVVLLVLAPAFALPAIGEDFADWSDNEVNAALAGIELEPPRQADLTLCSTIVADDTASAIDCEVNQALSGRSPTSVATTMLPGLGPRADAPDQGEAR